MLETFADQDYELTLLNASKYDIIQSITLKDVQYFLESLGVEQINLNEEKGYIICPTICHNPLHSAESMKLYWYQNNKIFRCYTECNEAMSIFQLYQKYMAINEHEVSDFEAQEYVKKCLKHINVSANTTSHYNFEFDREKYLFDSQIPLLPEYNKDVLTCFSHYYHPLWLKDGIKKDVMDKFHISFALNQNKIVIPHFDIHGRLIGIRARSLEPEDIQEFGKYRPIQVGDQLYTHPLHFNLYGIYEHQAGIRHRRSAIIAEGEKSVLLDDGYYGSDSNTVACCGSQINKYQISMLTNLLGATEITIAFDKEYLKWNDDRAKKYRKKIEDMCRKYLYQADFYYIWDYDDLLQEKDSPFDKGKEIFEHLYRNRVKVR